jgi:2-oxoglutarate dehydrogenase complex dehydrogenase (E1) component-like enzyme
MRIETCQRELGGVTSGRVLYAGRAPSAATATGYGNWHAKQMTQLMTDAMDLDYCKYMGAGH